MNHEILNMDEVKQLVGLSRSKIYMLIKDGRFPASLRHPDFGRSARWSRREIDAYVTAVINREAWQPKSE